MRGKIGALELWEGYEELQRNIGIEKWRRLILFDYECERCLKVHEEFHGMTERPRVLCKCGGICVKLIATGQMFCGVNGRADMYNFTDFNTTGKPVVINSKTQWRDHLKKHGLNDDVKNDPYTKSELEAKVQKKNFDKEIRRKEIKRSVVEVYKQRKTPQFKKRVQEVLQKGG